MTLPNPNLPWPLPLPDVADIADHEGCRLVSYRNFPNEPWTCGWGETDGVGPQTKWTQEYADQRFCDSLAERVHAVIAVCTVMPNANQLAALVSLTYNIGMGWEGKVKPPGAKDGLRQSTVLRQHNAGNFAAAANAFRLWNKVNGQEVDGLTRRRLKEAARYLTPVEGAVPTPMPQAVDAETNVSSSPIIKGAVVAGGVSIVDVAVEAGKSVETVKPAIVAARDVLANVVGIPPSWVLPALVIAACAVIVHWRLRQRREGWA